MYLAQLSLWNFRNYTRLRLHLPQGVTLLCGGNAHGKTNLLEAIYFLATTRSPYARAERHLINWLAFEREPLPFARVAGTAVGAGGKFELDITLLQEGDDRLRKEMRLNGVKKRAMDMLGRLTVVLFAPEDIELVTGSPALRRRYLDACLCQIDPAYCGSLARYGKVLVQRNALLKQLRERGGHTDQLGYWDEQLAGDGARLTLCRYEALRQLDEIARERHATLSAQSETLRLAYRPSLALDPPLSPGGGYPTGAPPVQLEALAAAFAAELAARRREELVRGMTLVGPHRDDFSFVVDGADLTLYGSRGQQRCAALALKLAEVAFMERTTGEIPLLLLDDVMSELDALRRAQVLNLMEKASQAIMTTTDWEDYTLPFREKACRLSVSGGVITPS